MFTTTHRMTPLDGVQLGTLPGAQGMAWVMVAMVAKLGIHCVRVRDVGSSNWGYGAPNRHGTPSIKIIDAGGFMTGQQATSWPSQKKYLKGFANMMAETGIQEQLKKIVEQSWDCHAILREVARKLSTLKGEDAAWLRFAKENNLVQ